MMVRRSLIIVSAVLALLSSFALLPNSGAIQQGRIERGTIAQTTGDANGFLKLEGFANPTVPLSNNYTHIAYMTNNSTQPLTVTVTITPDFTQVNNKKYLLRIKLNAAVSEFTYGSAGTLQTTMTLAPGQIVDVQGLLNNNQNKSVVVSYGFAVTDAAGTFHMQIGDTATTPRRITVK